MSGYVYVVQSSSGLFKVGYSSDPRRRLTMLKTSTADRLSLLGTIPGTMAQERELHALLSPWRVEREWFRPCRAIAALIASLDTLEVKRSKLDHPLLVHTKISGTTITQIARAANCSRVTIYRVIAGDQNATIDLLRRISAATNGAVSVAALLPGAAQ